jgi:hypothetical protein
MISFPRPGVQSDRVVLKGTKDCIELAKQRIQETVTDLVNQYLHAHNEDMFWKVYCKKVTSYILPFNTFGSIYTSRICVCVWSLKCT